MILDSLVIDKEDAKERLVHYEAALRTERNAEDEAIAAGYRAAARGLPVIAMRDTIQAGGFFDNGMPRLALARADAKTVRCSVKSVARQDLLGSVTYHTTRFDQSRGAIVGAHHVHVPVLTFPTADFPWRTAETIVPSVPPQYRPKKSRRLSAYHLLWEVEEWTKVVPVDPALLRHIRGDLWAVLAVWDLTPLERAVLSQRQ